MQSRKLSETNLKDKPEPVPAAVETPKPLPGPPKDSGTTLGVKGDDPAIHDPGTTLDS